MAEDRVQPQRFEMKYIISETTALAVREFVASYLEIDEFGSSMPNLSYPVHSLYMDSDQLRLYEETINGNKNRFKLRLRFYENRPKAPIYFEIKRRMNNTILKQRGAVKRNAVELLLNGHLPEREHMASSDPKQWIAIQNYCQLMNEIQAKPKVHVAYLREAWLTTDNNSIRVTLDRDVRSAPEPTARFITEMEDPVYAFENKVILELKFTGRFPDWFRDLVRVFHLTQESAAKYVDGITLMGKSRVNASFVL